MRRTSLMVLVLAVLFAATVMVTPALQGQASATHRAARAAHHVHKAMQRRTSHAAAARKTATSPCVAPTKAGHTRNRVTNRASSHVGSHSATQGRHSSNSRVAQAERHHRRPMVDAPASEPPTHAREALPPVNLPAIPTHEPLPQSQPEPQPVAFHWNRHVVPPPLRGSLASLERQNDRATAEGLERIEDEADLSDRIASGALVPLPASSGLTVNPDLPDHHRYCRSWTARFLSDLARSFDAQFHAALEVSSAVRTVEYQKRLMRVNGNAAPAEGDIASPHLTGATIDIAKKGMSSQQIGWMRSYLIPLQATGKIDVEEEFQQSCFHITVYKSYVSAHPPRSTRPRAGQSDAEVAGGETALGR